MSTNLATKIYVLSLTSQKESAIEEFKHLAQHHSKRRQSPSKAETQVGAMPFGSHGTFGNDRT